MQLEIKPEPSDAERAAIEAALAAEAAERAALQPGPPPPEEDEDQ